MRKRLKLHVTILVILFAAAIGTVVLLRSGREIQESVLLPDTTERRNDITGRDISTEIPAMDTNGHDDAERARISAAIADFQTKPRTANNYETARKLLPLIKVGMTAQEVRAILGEPGGLLEGGRSWVYTLFFSQYIIVRFDAKTEQVERVQSPLLAGEAQQ